MNEVDLRGWGNKSGDRGHRDGHRARQRSLGGRGGGDVSEEGREGIASGNKRNVKNNEMIDRIAAPWEAGALPPRSAASCGAARRASWRRAEDITASKLQNTLKEETFWRR